MGMELKGFGGGGIELVEEWKGERVVRTVSKTGEGGVRGSWGDLEVLRGLGRSTG